jgi:tetrapyrrole methylase family protein/MazG family protein
MLRIIGLGPGDPGLLTLGSLESLRAVGLAVPLLAPPELSLFLESEGVRLLRQSITDPDLFMRGGSEVIESFVAGLDGAEVALAVLGDPLSDFAGLPILLRALAARSIPAEIVPGMPRATLSAAIAMPLLPLPPHSTHHSWNDLVEVMARLRRSCPWDREQTHRSLIPYLIEEAYEVVDAVESDHDDDLCEELGDLLLQIVFHAQLATERGKFSIADVIDSLSNKMIRRHPHVFGDAHLTTLSEVWQSWERLKSSEAAAARRENRLDGIPSALGALQRSQKMQEKAARVGFDWPDPAGVLEKLHEELRELEEARAARALGKQNIRGGLADPDRHIREEMGDLLFTLVNLARAIGIDAEGALRDANEKFYARFTFMEKRAEGDRRELASLAPAEWEDLWQLAKAKRAGTNGRE